jgi:capsular polysaccharide biosynthesis protein
MIKATGLVDKTEFERNIVYFDANFLTFREQVKIMRNTDILIAPHGAGLQNILFMKKVFYVCSIKILLV